MNDKKTPDRRIDTGATNRISSSVVEVIVAAVTRGNFLTTAAKLAGIDQATIHLWMSKGREYNELPDGAPRPSTALLYSDLYDRVSTARAKLEAALVSTVATTALDKEDWRAATWFLERSFHKDWSRKSVATIEGNPDNPVQVQVSWAEGLKMALDAGDDDDGALEAEVVAVDGNEPSS